MAFSHFKTEAFFLKKRDHKEANQIFTVFSKKFGKIRVLGRSIRKVKSKLRSGADLFFLSEIEFVEGRYYKTLTAAERIKKFKNIYNSEKKMKRCVVIADMVDFLWGKEEQDEKLWNMLIGFFETMNNSKTNDELFYYFLWNFFSLSGFAPDLYNCCLCRKKLSSDFLRFYPNGGGLIDRKCFKKIDKSKKKKTIKISPETLEVIRSFLSNSLDKLDNIEINDKLLKNLSSVSESYFRFLKEQHKGF